MPKGRELVGLPVINREKGEEAGRVLDLLFDAQKGIIRALLLSKGGLIREPKVVYFDCVDSLDGKSFVISGEKEVSSEIPGNARSWRSIKGFPMLKADGSEMGTVEDLVVELPAGRIVALEVSAGLMEDLVEGRREIPVNGNIEWKKETVVIRN